MLMSLALMIWPKFTRRLIGLYERSQKSNVTAFYWTLFLSWDCILQVFEQSVSLCAPGTYQAQYWTSWMPVAYLPNMSKTWMTMQIFDLTKEHKEHSTGLSNGTRLITLLQDSRILRKNLSKPRGWKQLWGIYMWSCFLPRQAFDPSFPMLKVNDLHFVPRRDHSHLTPSLFYWKCLGIEVRLFCLKLVLSYWAVVPRMGKIC